MFPDYGETDPWGGSVCIIPNGILPALLILSVEGKELHDKLVDLGEGQHLATRVLDRHRDQGDQARQTEQQWGACFFTSSESFLFQLLQGGGGAGPPSKFAQGFVH